MSFDYVILILIDNITLFAKGRKKTDLGNKTANLINLSRNKVLFIKEEVTYAAYNWYYESNVFAVYKKPFESNS